MSERPNDEETARVVRLPFVGYVDYFEEDDEYIPDPFARLQRALLDPFEARRINISPDDDEIE